jgi:magnesium transporter
VQRTVALAVWMPVIAGMGGNAGTQALAVTVRRLALGLIPPDRLIRVVGKEVLVGVTNGLAIGVLVGIAASLLGEGPRLGLVVFLAMSGNLLVAGFAGAFIPVVLERFGVDPAIASSIFVTTFTDVCGFLLLLGLAGWLLL